MMIRIRYPNGRFDMIKASHLDRLLVAKQISSFKRQSGWVVLGQDPIRSPGNRIFCLGAERREPMRAGRDASGHGDLVLRAPSASTGLQSQRSPLSPD